MISMEWEPDQQNEIKFVMVDSNNENLPGLGATYTMKISKPGNTAFTDALGTKQEIGSGWYRYVSTAAEADTPGSVAIYLPAQGAAVENNLEYVVRQRTVGAVEHTYTVTKASDGTPIEGVDVWISTDSGGSNVVWSGVTDAFGVARDINDNKPLLDPGNYYFNCQKSGYTFNNPDLETVS